MGRAKSKDFKKMVTDAQNLIRRWSYREVTDGIVTALDKTLGAIHY